MCEIFKITCIFVIKEKPLTQNCTPADTIQVFISDDCLVRVGCKSIVSVVFAVILLLYDLLSLYCLKYLKS